MIKRICDKCGKEIKGNYWIIEFYEKEDDMMRVSATGAMNNLRQNTDRMLNRENEYCKECIEEIKILINNVEE